MIKSVCAICLTPRVRLLLNRLCNLTKKHKEIVAAAPAPPHPPCFWRTTVRATPVMVPRMMPTHSGANVRPITRPMATPIMMPTTDSGDTVPLLRAAYAVSNWSAEKSKSGERSERRSNSTPTT